MSCSGTNVCNCSGAACPRAAGVCNALGFGAGPACCKFPCPKFPIHHVKICIQVNQSTCVKIQQGCLLSQSGEDCSVDYEWGVVEDSWGRKCRVIEWNRQVPKDTFVRIRFCSCDACSTGCGRDTGGLLGAPTNKLLKLEVDGIDYVGFVQGVRDIGGVLGCVRAWCTGSTVGADNEGVCCQYDGAATPGINTVSWTSVEDLPWGAEIVFGPIGQSVFNSLIST